MLALEVMAYQEAQQLAAEIGRFPGVRSAIAVAPLGDHRAWVLVEWGDLPPMTIRIPMEWVDFWSTEPWETPEYRQRRRRLEPVAALQSWANSRKKHPGDER